MVNRYSPEVRARAVRMVFEHQGSYETQAIAAIAPKIGSVADSYDNALTETINGLYKTELVHRPWH